MAILFLQQKKFQKALLFAFFAALVVTVVILWTGFSPKKPPTATGEIIAAPERKVEIDFNVFDHSLLEKLRPYFQIRPIQETLPAEEVEIGRENPFLPY